MSGNELDVEKFKELLKVYYKDSGPERVGFILPNKVVEVRNVCPDPEEGFSVDPLDTIQYTEEAGALATWHTHPGSPSNLSGEDYRTFKVFTKLYHFIVGRDGVKCYRFEDSKKTLVEV